MSVDVSVSSRTDPDDDVVDVTSFSALDVVEINKSVDVSAVKKIRKQLKCMLASLL